MTSSASSLPNTLRGRSTEPAQLDDTDRRLLRLLAADARVPNNALAAEVGIAPSTCSLRVRRLQDIGAISGFHAELSPDALGLPIQAMIAVRLLPGARTAIGTFTDKLAALPGVLNVFFVAGPDDFLLHVAARSSDDLRDFVVRYLSASREMAATQTSLIFEHMATRKALV